MDEVNFRKRVERERCWIAQINKKKRGLKKRIVRTLRYYCAKT